MHLFLLEAHSRHAALKSKSSKQGHSIEINSSCTVILLLRRVSQRCLYPIQLRKALSQSAVEAGISWAMAARLQMFGNTKERFFFFTIVAITSCSVWQRICTLKWHSCWNLTGTIFAKCSISGSIQYWLSSSRLLSKQVLNMQITSLRLRFLHMHLLSRIWSISRQSQISAL